MLQLLHKQLLFETLKELSMLIRYATITQIKHCLYFIFMYFLALKLSIYIGFAFSRPPTLFATCAAGSRKPLPLK